MHPKGTLIFIASDVQNLFKVHNCVLNLDTLMGEKMDKDMVQAVVEDYKDLKRMMRQVTRSDEYKKAVNEKNRTMPTPFR